MKRLRQWINVPDDTITKVSLAVLETETQELQNQIVLPKFKNKILRLPHLAITRRKQGSMSEQMSRDDPPRAR